MNDLIEYIKQWIIKADHDLGTAKVTYLHIPEFKDTVTFHCQQAVEKYLKAYLIFLEIEFKHTHDLVYLLDILFQKDKDIKNYYDKISQLQNYAVEVRYPNETIFLTDEKILDAINTSKKIREYVTLKMNININYNEIIDK